MARTRSSSSKNNWGIFSMLSFIAVAFIGLALMLAWIFNGNAVSDWLNAIAFFLACIIVAYYSYFYAVRSGQTRGSLVAHVLIWAGAITLIVIFRIMPLINS